MAILFLERIEIMSNFCHFDITFGITSFDNDRHLEFDNYRHRSFADGTTKGKKAFAIFQSVDFDE